MQTVNVSFDKKETRYPRIPLRVQEHEQALRGRQLFIDYMRCGEKVIVRKVVASPLTETDIPATGFSKIQHLLLDNHIGLSQVRNVSANHADFNGVLLAINRRAFAASH